VANTTVLKCGVSRGLDAFWRAQFSVHRHRCAFTGTLPQLTGRPQTAATFRSTVASQVTNTAALPLPDSSAGTAAAKEIAMFAFIEFSRNTQRAVCLLVSAVIVAAGLSLGAIEAQSALHDGYSVTITQLQ
jgi:hypothetical protein